MQKKSKRIGQRIYKIDTTEERFFKEYLSIMRPFMNAQITLMMERGEVKSLEEDIGDKRKKKKNNPHFISLTEGDQLNILAGFFYYNDKFSDLGDAERVKLLNDHDIKARISTKVYEGRTTMTNTNYFRSFLSGLRNSLCIVDKKTEGKRMINPLFEILPKDKFRIIFEFNIKDRKDEL